MASRKPAVDYKIGLVLDFDGTLTREDTTSTLAKLVRVVVKVVQLQLLGHGSAESDRRSRGV